MPTNRVLITPSVDLKWPKWGCLYDAETEWFDTQEQAIAHGAKAIGASYVIKETDPAQYLKGSVVMVVTDR